MFTNYVPSSCNKFISWFNNNHHNDNNKLNCVSDNNKNNTSNNNNNNNNKETKWCFRKEHEKNMYDFDEKILLHMFLWIP